MLGMYISFFGIIYMKKTPRGSFILQILKDEQPSKWLYHHSKILKNRFVSFLPYERSLQLINNDELLNTSVQYLH